MAPVRLALFQERPYSFLGVGELTGRGHDLDGVGVRLGLIEVELGVERLLADPLAVGRAARGPLEQVADRFIEASGGHHPIDQAPVERRVRVDDVSGQGQLHGALAAHVPGYRHHGGVAEPAALAARRREAGVFARHRQVGGGDELAACRGREPVHPGHHRLRYLLHHGHQLGARLQQRADPGQVGACDIGEVMPGAEYRAVAGQHDAEYVAAAEVAEGSDQLAHVRQGQRIPALRPVHRDGGEITRTLDEDVLELHGVKHRPETRPCIAPPPRRPGVGPP
jgi:hypothetical protein